MTSTKTIRLNVETYRELLAYKAELEIENGRTLSFDDAVDLLFSELAGREYELASMKLAARDEGSQT
ncbi:MAG: hypothetical protein AAGI03_07700 [Pseudomonadota bacterium]